MKKHLTLIAVILLLSNVSRGQNQKHFTHLFSGKTIYANNIEYVSNSYFLIDEKKEKKETVKFFKNYDGFFANMKHLNFSGSSSFVKREIAGNINLFSRERITYTNMMGANGMMMFNPSPNLTISYYYNKGTFGELKKSNYKNLKIDLSDNIKSMVQLNKFKKVKQRETLLYILGSAVMTVGVVSLINKTGDVPENITPKTSGSFVIIGVGFGTLITNYLTTKNKHDHIKNAINIYNF